MTAEEYLLAISTSADGSSAAVHLISAEGRLNMLGSRLEADISTQASSATLSLSSDVVTSTATMSTTTATAETNSLTSAITCP